MIYVLDMTARPSLVVLATDDPLEAATVANKYATEANASVVITNGPAPSFPGTVETQVAAGFKRN